MHSGANPALGVEAPDRVVLFHDFSQALGGASYLVQVLIRQLAARGQKLTFITGDDGANFTYPQAGEADADIELVALGGKALLERGKLDAMTSGLYFREAAARTRAWIAAHDTPRTIYHVHGWCKVLTPATFGPRAAVADRVILHGHDYFNGCPNGGLFNFQTIRDCPLEPLSRACLTTQCDKAGWAQKLWRSGREGLRRSLVGEAGTAANRLLMIHPGQQPQFEQAGWPARKLVAVPNPVTPPCAERVMAERNRGVVFIGRISAEKGADLAAAAAARAGIPITFVGDGEEMDAVRAINPAAIMLGRQDRAGVAAALQSARMAVMPSRWSEPFGLVALEAAGSGVPVIVSDRALVADGIAATGMGLALETSDIDAFAAAMRQLSEDDAMAARMSTAGHARYAELCNSEESWAEEICANYASVLGHRAADAA